jgi:hypothetical protein
MPVPACESRCAHEGPSSEAEPARGGVSPRVRRNPLEGAFYWATLVGRGGHHSVGRVVCVCLGKRCISFCFFVGFKLDSPGFLGDP